METTHLIPTHRIGLLIPSSNSMLETDFHRLIEANCSIHSARMYLEDISIKALARMVDEYALISARDLLSIEPDVVVFGSCSAAILRGNKGEDILIRKLEEIVHVAVISAMKASRDRLKAKGFLHLAVLTPYGIEINQQIRSSLEQDGFKVKHIEGLSQTRYGTIARLPIDQIINLALQITEGVVPQAVFLCGTNLPVLPHNALLNSMLPCPVVTVNQAVIEAVLDTINPTQKHSVGEN